MRISGVNRLDNQEVEIEISAEDLAKQLTNLGFFTEKEKKIEELNIHKNFTEDKVELRVIINKVNELVKQINGDRMKLMEIE